MQSSTSDYHMRIRIVSLITKGRILKNWEIGIFWYIVGLNMFWQSQSLSTHTAFASTEYFLCLFPGYFCVIFWIFGSVYQFLHLGFFEFLGENGCGGNQRKKWGWERKLWQFPSGYACSCGWWWSNLLEVIGNST